MNILKNLIKEVINENNVSDGNDYYICTNCGYYHNSGEIKSNKIRKRTCIKCGKKEK